MIVAVVCSNSESRIPSHRVALQCLPKAISLFSFRCTVRGDLVRILDGLMKRKGKFDAIIETTGLAYPAPVAQTFFIDENVGRRTKLDGAAWRRSPTPSGSMTG